ncbi:MAG: hypothetical protein HRU03_03225 [Nanoarchaeales archaeon]|nr:hypothetical protein [Nanoarchaeales archaeon]
MKKILKDITTILLFPIIWFISLFIVILVSDWGIVIISIIPTLILASYLTNLYEKKITLYYDKIKIQYLSIIFIIEILIITFYFTLF